MALRVEHELHRRRLGRNLGVGLVLAALVAMVFGLTVVKVVNLGGVQADSHVAPGSSGSSAPAPEATTGGSD